MATHRREAAADSSAGTVAPGPLAAYLHARPLAEVGPNAPLPTPDSQAVLVARRRLQLSPDHRATLQAWFAVLAPGGHLVVTVPHAFLDDRRLELPSPRDFARRRLYTPASLLAEVEEALVPNSYRIRYLSDADAGYDYALSPETPPVGESDVALVLQRIPLPAWGLNPDPPTLAPAPDWSFEPARTRVEVRALPASPARVLLLKLDHMGDFIMGLPVLARARALFPAAEITLVVGPWNRQLAEEAGIVDRVIPFGAFPRNSSEEEVDVPGKVALFQAAVPGEYDLAIDLRTDTDTRTLLRHVRAPVRAGIGTAAQFPFLDIFLPLDFNRNRAETAREVRLAHDRFHTQHHVRRLNHRLVSDGVSAERHCGVLWGPYDQLRPGHYQFEPFFEWAPAEDGMLLLDVAIDKVRASYRLVPGDGERLSLPFTVERPDAEFEFRVWTVADMPAIGFSFYGGRLLREGGHSTLHQTEYGSLLLELVALRLARTGLLADASA